MITDLRIKLRHFFRKNGKIVLIVISIWIIIFIINKFLKNYNPVKELQTTYTPHTAVITDKNMFSSDISEEIEKMISQYVEYCNNAEWTSAYNMLSGDCKKYAYQNDIKNYMNYVYTKMPTEKKYAIQDFSNINDVYIYQVKYTDDFLATGLTNSTYQYTEDKIVFKKNDDKTLDMSVGNFIEHKEIKNISENDYLKVDVKSVNKYYSIEQYEIKLSNRTENTIVVSDGVEEGEIVIELSSGDIRERVSPIDNVVLGPRESATITIDFPKFYDNDDSAVKLSFGAIRVMEKYSGVTDVDKTIIQSELQNTIAKFSVNIPIKN